MSTARQIAFAAVLLSHAALAIGLVACDDRPAVTPPLIAAAAPPPAIPRATPLPPVEPVATPTPDEKKEFERTGPK